MINKFKIISVSIYIVILSSFVIATTIYKSKVEVLKGEVKVLESNIDVYKLQIDKQNRVISACNKQMSESELTYRRQLEAREKVGELLFSKSPQVTQECGVPPFAPQGNVKNASNSKVIDEVIKKDISNMVIDTINNYWDGLLIKEASNLRNIGDVQQP